MNKIVKGILIAIPVFAIAFAGAYFVQISNARVATVKTAQEAQAYLDLVGVDAASVNNAAQNTGSTAGETQEATSGASQEATSEAAPDSDNANNN